MQRQFQRMDSYPCAPWAANRGCQPLGMLFGLAVAVHFWLLVRSLLHLLPGSRLRLNGRLHLYTGRKSAHICDMCVYCASVSMSESANDTATLLRNDRAVRTIDCQMGNALIDPLGYSIDNAGFFLV